MGRAGSRPGNLPADMTSFVGRRRELAELKRLVSTTRLLTLTGAGGAGKTRLALRAAAELARSLPDGAWFVSLAPIDDPLLLTLSPERPGALKAIKLAVAHDIKVSLGHTNASAEILRAAVQAE